MVLSVGAYFLWCARYFLLMSPVCATDHTCYGILALMNLYVLELADLVKLHLAPDISSLDEVELFQHPVLRDHTIQWSRWTFATGSSRYCSLVGPLLGNIKHHTVGRPVPATGSQHRPSSGTMPLCCQQLSQISYCCCPVQFCSVIWTAVALKTKKRLYSKNESLNKELCPCPLQPSDQVPYSQVLLFSLMHCYCCRVKLCTHVINLTKSLSVLLTPCVPVISWFSPSPWMLPSNTAHTYTYIFYSYFKYQHISQLFYDQCIRHVLLSCVFIHWSGIYFCMICMYIWSHIFEDVSGISVFLSVLWWNPAWILHHCEFFTGSVMDRMRFSWKWYGSLRLYLHPLICGQCLWDFIVVQGTHFFSRNMPRKVMFWYCVCVCVCERERERERESALREVSVSC